MTKYVLLNLLLLTALNAFAQVSGLGAKKDFAPLWLSDCKDKLKEYREENMSEPIQSALPFFGKKLREQGYQLPLPMGIGINVIGMQQTNKLNEFKLHILGEEIPYELQFYDLQSSDMNVTFRPDIWIFPFLNVYGVLGYTWGSIKPAIVIPGIVYDDPILGEIVISESIIINELIEYKGSTFGFGTTLAGGFKKAFFTLDYNYTVSKMDIISDNIIAHTITPRIGISLDAYNTLGTGVLYIGGMYLLLNQKIRDAVNIREIDPDIADLIGDEIGYSMVLGVKEPLNFIIGGGWQINRHMNLMLEAGLGDRSQLMFGFDYRF